MLSSENVATILLVDDDTKARRSLVAMLRSAGHSIVGQAEHGREALGLLTSGCNPDVIMLDLETPFMNGREFLATLQRDFHPLPSVIVVGSFDVDEEPLPVFAEIANPVDDAEQLELTVRAAASFAMSARLALPRQPNRRLRTH